jgi:hypothetical protein
MKIIFHCGSSKNGSTALQSILLKNFGQLIHQGIFPLICYYDKDFSISDRNVYDVDSIFFHTDRLIDPIKIKNATATFGIPYQIYKQFIFERNATQLKALLSKIKATIARIYSYTDIHTLIISAEAFETSLCLKDPVFRKILKVLSKQYDVELVYYKPDPVRYVIASWLEWGWIEHFQYPEWVAAYSVTTNRSEFFARRSVGVRYFPNLLDTLGWVDYWRVEKRLRFTFVDDQKDIVDHFFRSILNIDFMMPDFNHALSLNDRNVGWPKSLITIYPLFFDFLCQEYTKFDVIRQLLRDKELSYKSDLSSYNKIVRLTSVILDEIISLDPDSNPESKRLIDSAMANLRDIFENSDKRVAQRVITFLSETFYFYHVNQFEDTKP